MHVAELKEIRPGVWSVTMDTGEVLRASPDDVVEFGLYEGRELSQEAAEELRTGLKKSDAKGKALRMLSRRALSRHEVVDRLRQKGVAEDTALETADWLEERRFIDDSEYAGMVVRHYTGKGYGAARVKSELTRRGIPRELAEAAMDEFYTKDEKYLDSFLRSRMKGHSMEDRKYIKKVTDALARRGFSWNDISAALRRCEVEFGDMDYEQ